MATVDFKGLKLTYLMYLFIDLLIDGWTDESIDPSIHRSINQLID